MSEVSELVEGANIQIDVREHDLIEYCVTNNIPHQTGALQVGDIILSTEGEACVLIFERKTIADLAASIKDGRYREQKQRLKSTYPFHRITYIIEGSTRGLKAEKVAGMPSKALMSALISSRYRDGFQVIHTVDVTDTMWYLLQIRDRMGEKTTFDTEHGGEYSAALRVKTKKIDNLTPELVYRMQLSQIPSISMLIAAEIVKMYPSMGKLILAIEEKGVKALMEIDGMGKARCKTVVDYLVGL